MPINLQIVTAERLIFEGDVDEVNVPGQEGDMGILPKHAPLMTTLRAGEIVVVSDKQSQFFAVSGGFLEVRPERVIILADSAERADEIDVARAQEAVERAKVNINDKANITGFDAATAEAALARALTRVKVANKRRKNN